jgi:hypothetical protein
MEGREGVIIIIMKGRDRKEGGGGCACVGLGGRMALLCSAVCRELPRDVSAAQGKAHIPTQKEQVRTKRKAYVSHLPLTTLLLLKKKNVVFFFFRCCCCHSLTLFLLQLVSPSHTHAHICIDRHPHALSRTRTPLPSPPPSAAAHDSRALTPLCFASSLLLCSLPALLCQRHVPLLLSPILVCVHLPYRSHYTQRTEESSNNNKRRD